MNSFQKDDEPVKFNVVSVIQRSWPKETRKIHIRSKKTSAIGHPSRGSHPESSLLVGDSYLPVVIAMQRHPSDGKVSDSHRLIVEEHCQTGLAQEWCLLRTGSESQPSGEQMRIQGSYRQLDELVCAYQRQRVCVHP